jgi:hypothetical protein
MKGTATAKPAGPEPVTPRRCKGEAQIVGEGVNGFALPAGEPDAWFAIDEAPYGIPVQVRGGLDGRALAIRHAFIEGGFYNADRSAPLGFIPDGWAPL